MSQLLRRLVALEPGEAPALLGSFATLFLTFASYTILRPVRDALGVTSGLENVPYLFWGVFVVMLLLQPVYGWLTTRHPREVFLPWTYGFFAANLIGFWVWFRLSADHAWIARTYYVWVSVFALFVVATFWSLMADVFTREQAGRLFGFIWAGASTGGLVGPLIARKLAVPLGAINLLPLSAGLLLLALALMGRVIAWHRARGGTPSAGTARDVLPAAGGGTFAAFGQVARSPYLLGIVLFVLLMTWVSTFLYLEQLAFVAKAYHTTDERTRFNAGVDLWVQGASLVMQFLLFGRLFRWFGMRALLAVVPVLMVIVYAVFANYPFFWVAVGAYALRRAADYSITRPCRDALFTVVSREEKYQAKSLIDTFAYRGGDAVSGSLYKALSGAGGTLLVGWAGALIAAAWAAVALALGRAYQLRSRARGA
jgi:ATP:ADP antiporter, AAA family